MKKIWGKILENHKIIADFVLKLDAFCIDDLYEYLKEICYNLKIETPILLNKHINQFEEYNMTKFSKDDFVDHTNFDSFIIEYFED